MKKVFVIVLASIFAVTLFTACGSRSSKLDAEQVKAVFANEQEEETQAVAASAPSTVYLSSTKNGAVTKAANPVIGINFDTIDRNYSIVKTRSNFKVDPVYGDKGTSYVMFDTPDETVIGDFENGFATVISTKWEDLVHVYDLENNVVYKVVTPLETNKIKKISDNKYAIRCGTAEKGYRTYSFSTSEKYAFDLFENDNDVVMIVDGGHEYDVAKELAQEAEGATTKADESTVSDSPDEKKELPSERKIKLASSDPESSTGANDKKKSQDISADPAKDAEKITSQTGNTEASVKPDNNTEPAEELNSSDSNEEPGSLLTLAEAEDDNTSQQTDNDSDTITTSETEADTAAVSETETVTEEVIDAEQSSDSAEEEEIETTVFLNDPNGENAEVSEDQIYSESVSLQEESRHTDIAGGRIINVELLSQFPYYPTGCESISTVMALHYHGEDISADDFINRYLDQSTEFYFQDGLKYGPSPYEYFIGSPYDSSGFGCLAPVIYNALLKYYDNNKAKVVNASGLPMEKLCLDYINHDLPVLVWVNICMVPAYDSNTWLLEDGTEFTWLANEHCMLLVGYDEYNYYFNDPYTGAVLSYPKDVSVQCYEQQGSQAVVIMD